jgi:enoyl-CoA hydratase/carnithine racemase
MAIAADSAIFGTPEATPGVIPPIMSTFGPTLIDHKNAHELAVTTQRTSEQRAQEIGLVNKVVPA